ncbi:MAG: hypothetical protein ABSF34_17210 [Verrucomicrobiota bacterium]
MASDKKSQQAVCSRVARILRQEREMRNPTLETLLRMAAALEIDLARVLRQAQSAGEGK